MYVYIYLCISMYLYEIVHVEKEILRLMNIENNPMAIERTAPSLMVTLIGGFQG